MENAAVGRAREVEPELICATPAALSLSTTGKPAREAPSTLVPSAEQQLQKDFYSNHTFCFWEISVLLALVWDKAQPLQAIPLKSEGRAWPVQRVPECHSLRYEFAILMKITWGQVFKGLKSPAFQTDSSPFCRGFSTTTRLRKQMQNYWL